ncbi:lipoyl(octanoyl) transferase LipB [Flavimobilis sp. GY10621]|uniref:Octanoyltransferase n=1 Tax=Flavimobilis rhizosphaerae TaxID=2775421 RepID=A0ABR9DSV9_9MICO|nr:lipoyl(octanoyl) transferase LipB [Flavimobilis rhizosphaerae]MBD9700218.1 lipoyl(octanoyl) transferase LipB [Flavimobilis rhizosphaerae]
MDVVDLGLGTQLRDFEETWELQRRVHSDVLEGRRPDTLLVLEHAGVYTAGRRTRRSDLPTDGTRVVEIDRGGRITWHGPGQLVVYPILRLAEPVDVVAYVRALEEAIITLCTDHGLATVRVDGRSGVWVPGAPDAKVAAIGCRVAKGVTMHGLALNVDPDLTAFDRIVPCGIDDADVTSLTRATGVPLTPAGVADRLVDHLARELAPLRASGPSDLVRRTLEESSA